MTTPARQALETMREAVLRLESQAEAASTQVRGKEEQLTARREQIATLEAEKAAAVAKAERLESELSRYQRADVGETVRFIETQHETSFARRVKVIEMTRHMAVAVADSADQQRGMLLAIVRQQQVRIEEQAAEIERLRRLSALGKVWGRLARFVKGSLKQAHEIQAQMLSDLGARDRRIHQLELSCEYREEQSTRRLLEWDDVKKKLDRERLRSAAWKRCAKKWRASRLRAYEGDTDKVPRVEPEVLGAAESLPAPYRCERCGMGPPDRDVFMAGKRNVLCAHCKAETDSPVIPLAPSEPCESCGRFSCSYSCPIRTRIEQENEKSAKGDEYRPGLPPLALRMAWKEWEDDYGDVLVFDATGEEYAYRTVFRGSSSGHFYQPNPDAPGDQFNRFRHRPHGKTRAEVEILAAKMLGASDAREGREHMGLVDLFQSIRGGPIGIPDNTPESRAFVDAYSAAYGAAKGG